MCEVFCTDNSSDSNMVDFSRFYLPILLSALCLIQEGNPWGSDLDFEVR